MLPLRVYNSSMTQMMPDNLWIEVLPTTELDAPQRAAIVRLCTTAFAQDFSTLFDLVPATASHILARLNDTLIGHATWMPRWLQPDQQRALRTAYVDAVAILPMYQERGIGSRIMRHLVAQIQDYELAALATSHLTFYQQLGWELWRGPLGARLKQGVQPTPNEQVMILRLPKTPPDLDLSLPLSVEWRAGSVW
jgi:aminoglycoside 2'-N-acetyltransferase I